jgi:putative transcription factor
MASCEMCGKERELVDSIVEGAVVQVCLECSKHGNVIAINQPVVDKKIEKMQEMKSRPEYVDVVINDYNDRIRKARERKGMKQEDLAQALAEKESVIQSLESGGLKPTFKLAKKLSVFLGIDLIESVETANKSEKNIDFGNQGTTIGDLLKKE